MASVNLWLRWYVNFYKRQNLCCVQVTSNITGKQVFRTSFKVRKASLRLMKEKRNRTKR